MYHVRGFLRPREVTGRRVKRMPTMAVFDPRIFLCVAAGAACGGCLRVLLSLLAIARFGALSAPIATACINISGSLAIGYCAASFAGRDAAPLLKWFVVSGVLGGYTTFSTFSLEALAYLQQGRIVNALLYTGGSVGLGIAGTFAGLLLGRR